MENRAHAVATGFFILILGAALLAGAYWLTGGTFKGVPYDVTTEQSVAGLSPGSSVRLRGVEIGEVEKIGFDPQNRRVVRVRITVNPHIPLMVGTFAREKSLGISGSDYIELNYPDNASRALETSIWAPTQIPMERAGLGVLTDDTGQLFREFSETLHRVDAILTPENAKRIGELVAHADVAVTRISAIAQDLEPATKRFPVLETRAENLLGSAQTAMGDADSLVVQVRARVDTLDAVRDAAHDAGYAVRDLDRALVNDALPRIDTLADRLTRNSDTLEEVLHELQDQPQSVLFGLPPRTPGPGEPGFHPTAQQQ
jgi:phospholipid/cholesterol/gamma-HCH transport system substrate-binding protein